MPQFFATCASSLEYLLKDELIELGAENVKEGLSLVHFDADWPTVYKILMWTRVASRILFPIAKFEAKDDQTLYDNSAIIDWSQHIRSNGTFLVNAQSFRSEMTHTKFIAQRIKDAIVDHFTDADEQRPDVEFEQADVVVQCRIRQNQVTLSIDLAGEGLHHRGYRLKGGAAPIKENLAAALLVRAGWQAEVLNKQSKQLSLYDPMCGSGTFLIEAAMMALNIAPGYYRDYLGLYGWRQFDSELWSEILQEAKNERLDGEKINVSIQGSDLNPKAIRSAQSNIALAELSDVITTRIAGIDQIDQFELPSDGLVIVNPPYSERLGEKDEVKKLYGELGNLLKITFTNWRASILSPNKEFGHALGIRAKKIYKFNNGSIPCELLNIDILPQNYLKAKNFDQVDPNFKDKLSDSAIQLCNRIEKNRKGLKKYLSKNNITCYRIYDADLPEYNAAIDIYDDKIHIQEYRPPRSIDDKVAAGRLKDIQRVAAGLFQFPLSRVYVKQRRQQKGDWQYSTKGRDSNGSEVDKEFFTILEAGRKFRVNLRDYLDTGLFIDHRQTRQLVADLSVGKSLLNLFCYTGSVSLYAATQGASKTTSVDLSNTYLSWARENFSLNGQLNSESKDKHHFIRSDILYWLSDASARQEKFDVIFLDPPTFSNSKKMETHFDVQHDHVKLIEDCLSILSPGGTLIFSNNFKQFKMEFRSCEGINVKEITNQTTTQDFQRKPLHRCWLIEKN